MASAPLFSTITTLQLTHARLDVVPPCIASMGPRLRELDLHHNHITDFPARLCAALTNLRVLNLARNRLASLPDNVDSLVHLRTLILSHNALTALPQTITTMASLYTLAVEGNPFSSVASPTMLPATATSSSSSSLTMGRYHHTCGVPTLADLACRAWRAAVQDGDGVHTQHHHQVGLLAEEGAARTCGGQQCRGVMLNSTSAPGSGGSGEVGEEEERVNDSGNNALAQLAAGMREMSLSHPSPVLASPSILAGEEEEEGSLPKDQHQQQQHHHDHSDEHSHGDKGKDKQRGAVWGSPSVPQHDHTDGHTDGDVGNQRGLVCGASSSQPPPPPSPQPTLLQVCMDTLPAELVDRVISFSACASAGCGRVTFPACDCPDFVLTSESLFCARVTLSSVFCSRRCASVEADRAAAARMEEEEKRRRRAEKFNRPPLVAGIVRTSMGGVNTDEGLQRSRSASL